MYNNEIYICVPGIPGRTTFKTDFSSTRLPGGTYDWVISFLNVHIEKWTPCRWLASFSTHNQLVKNRTSFIAANSRQFCHPIGIHKEVWFNSNLGQCKSSQSRFTGIYSVTVTDGHTICRLQVQGPDPSADESRGSAATVNILFITPKICRTSSFKKC